MSNQGSPYDPLIDQAAQEYGLDPQLFRAQLYQESHLNPTLISPKGAAGIAQFMPATSQQYGIDPMNPTQAIPAAARMMRSLLGPNGTDYPTALAAYNWGPGNLQRYGIANAPPETVNYVNAIMGAQQQQQQQAPTVDDQYTPTGNVIAPQAQPQPQAQPSTDDQYTPTGNVIAPQAQMQPQPSTDDQYTPTGNVIAPQAQPQPQQAPPWYSFSDVPAAATSAITDVMREAVQTGTGQAFTDQPGQAPPPPRSVPGEITYGLVHSMPTLSAALIGGGAGALVPGAGESGLSEAAGAALGGGGMAAAQELAPAYNQARTQLHMTHDQAMDYAIKSAGTQGVLGVVAPFLRVPYVKSVIGKFLAQSLVVQPAVGAAAQTAVPLLTGQPLPSGADYAKGYGENVATGAAAHIVTTLARAGATAAKGRFTTPEEIINDYNTRTNDKAYTPPPPRETDQNHSAMAQPLNADGRFPVDDRGFVVSTKGGPLRFNTQYEAARWMLDVGQKQAPDGSTWDLENHPSGSGFALRETTEQAPPAPAPESEPAPAPAPARDLVRDEEPPPTPAPTGAPDVETTPQPGTGISEPPAPGPQDVGPVQPVGPTAGVPADQGGSGGAAVVPPVPGEPAPEPTAPAGPAPVGDVPVAPTAPAPIGTEPAPIGTDQKPVAAEGGPGTKVVLRTQDGRLEVPANYEVADLSQLKAASGDLQPRDRAGRAASDVQIAQNAAQLDPKQLMAGPTADYGAPVVTPEGTVLAGNGRVATIARAAELHPEKYQAYVDAIKAAGHDVSGMKTPVLVRRTGTMSPQDQVAFARDSNVPRAMAMSPVEQAKLDASNLTDDQVARYVPGHQPWVRDWVGSLPASEQARVIDAQGRLSQEGQRRLQGALLHKAYGSEDVTTRALESPNDDTKGITASLADAAPRWAALRGKIATGQLPSEFDITPQLTRALDMIREGRDRGLTPADTLNQHDAFAAKLDPVTEELYRSFYNDALTRLRSRPKLTGILQDYVQAASTYHPGPDMLGHEAAPNPAQILRDARVGEEGFLSQDTTPEDTTTAALPADQPKLNSLNSQLDKLAPGPQRDKLTSTRDALLAKRGRAGKKPIYTGPPKATGAPKDFRDYQFQNGTPVYRQAFEDAGHNPDLAVNYPIRKQVEILRAQTEKHFGFPSVTVHDDANHKDARDALLDFYRAAQDMMHSLGFPNTMASFEGKTKLEVHGFGPRSPNLGMYDPADRSLHIYGRANSFGHEWIHAFDHDLAHTLSQPQFHRFLATQLGRAGKLDPADPMAQRMGHLLNTLFHNQAELAAKKIDLQIKAQETDKLGKPTRAAIRAQKDLDFIGTGTKLKPGTIKETQYREMALKFGDPKYWANEAELLARAGEAYLARIMEDARLDPRGVLMPDEAYMANTDQRLRMTFPKQNERTDIFQAFDHLMDGYRDTALHGSIAAARAAQGGNSDPSVWGKLNPGAKLGPVKMLVHRLRNLGDTNRRASLTDPNRPDPGAKHLRARLMSSTRQMFFTRLGVVESIRDLAPPEARQPIQQIIDRIGYTAGSGRYTGHETFEEIMQNVSRTAMARYTNILSNNGLDPDFLTEELGQQLRHVMTTGEDTYPTDFRDPVGSRVPVDPRVIKAAGPLRSLSDDLYTQLNNAGVKMGYAKSGHYTRIYDALKADANPDGFVKAASVVYRKMFDAEVGQPGDNPQKLLDQWKHATSGKNDTPPALHDGMDDLDAALRKMRKIEKDIAENGSTPAKLADHDKARQEAEQLAQQHHDDVGDYIANMGANDWLHNLRTYDPNDIEKGGPGGGFVNARVLPPDADLDMREFMITDPMAVLPRYYEAAARKIAQARTFGPNNEIRDELLAKAQAGGLHKDDAKLIKDIIDSITGRANNNKGPWAAATNTAHTLASIALMGRSVYSMLAEPANIALATNEVGAALHAFAAHFSSMYARGSARDRAELFDFLGITTSVTHDDIVANRTGADYSDSPKLGKFMAQYYRITLSTQVTNWNRRSTGVASHWLLRKWSRDLLDTTKSAAANYRRNVARRWFNELGVGSMNADESQNIQKEFAQWMTQQPGLPDIHTVENSPHGENYARAMRRLNRRGVIDPTKAERPLATDDGWTKLIFQLQTFAFGYMRNILNAMGEHWHYAYEHHYQYSQARGDSKWYSRAMGTSNAAWAMSKTGAAIAGVLFGNVITTLMRQFLFSHDDWKKHEQAGDLNNYIFDLAMSRSGLSGPLDPVMQVLTNLRYTQDLSSLFQGPALKYLGKNGYDVIRGAAALAGGETDPTNTRYHDAARGIYNLIGVPAEALIATFLGRFGPIGEGTGSAFEQYATSPQAAEDFATMVAGPKGTKLEAPGADQGLSPLGGLDGGQSLPSLNDAGQGEAPAAGEEGPPAQGAGAVPWGMLDDVAVPAWRAMKPAMGFIPKPLRALGLAAGAAYAAKSFWDKAEPYRNAPQPEDTEVPDTVDTN